MILHHYHYHYWVFTTRQSKSYTAREASVALVALLEAMVVVAVLFPPSPPHMKPREDLLQFWRRTS